MILEIVWSEFFMNEWNEFSFQLFRLNRAPHMHAEQKNLHTLMHTHLFLSVSCLLPLEREVLNVMAALDQLDFCTLAQLERGNCQRGHGDTGSLRQWSTLWGFCWKWGQGCRRRFSLAGVCPPLLIKMIVSDSGQGIGWWEEILLIANWLLGEEIRTGVILINW